MGLRFMFIRLRVQHVSCLGSGAAKDEGFRFCKGEAVEPEADTCLGARDHQSSWQHPLQLPS